MQRVISSLLEKDLELLGLTGVEDKLQVAEREGVVVGPSFILAGGFRPSIP